MRSPPLPPGRVSPHPVGIKKALGPTRIARCTGREGPRGCTCRRASHNCAVSATCSAPPTRVAKRKAPGSTDKPCTAAGAALLLVSALSGQPRHWLAALAMSTPAPTLAAAPPMSEGCDCERVPTAVAALPPTQAPCAAATSSALHSPKRPKGDVTLRGTA